MKGLAVRAEAEEAMDAPGLDPAVYAAVLADLAKVNAVTMAARPTLGFLARALRDRKSFTLLDIGFGGGDMLRRIARWAARRGVEARLVGVDLNPNSAPVADAMKPPAMRIDHRTGDYADQGDFDLIVSSLVAHHMTREQLIAFLRHMEAHARIGWLVNDLHRRALPHRAFPILARIMRWHPIVRADGTLSIARSYRPAEWPALLDEAGISREAARVHRAFPYRLCVERIF